MAESLLVGHNFVSSISKIEPKKLTKKLKPKNLILFVKTSAFTKP